MPIRGFVGIVVALMVLGVGTASANHRANNEVLIGGAISQTGRYAEPASRQVNSIKLWVDEVNGRDPVDRTVAKAMAGGSTDAAVESLALHIAKLSEKLAAALAENERLRAAPGTPSE